MGNIQTWAETEDQYTKLLFEIYESQAPAEWRLNLLGEFQQQFALAPTISKQAAVIAQTRARLEKGVLGNGMPLDENEAPQNAF